MTKTEAMKVYLENVAKNPILSREAPTCNKYGFNEALSNSAIPGLDFLIKFFNEAKRIWGEDDKTGYLVKLKTETYETVWNVDGLIISCQINVTK